MPLYQTVFPRLARLLTVVLLSAIALCEPLFAIAQSCDATSTECPDITPAEDGQQAPDDGKVISTLDNAHQMASSGLQVLASRIDEFFANEKVYREATGSYIRITGDTVWREAADIGYTGNIRIKLNLPQTKKKFRLIFETNPDEQRSIPDGTLQKTTAEASEETSYYTGLQAQSGKIEAWDLRTTLGLKISTPLDYFVRFRVSKTRKKDGWSLRPEETVYWFDRSGIGADTSFEIDRLVSEHVLLRSRSFARWTDENDYFDVSQVFSIFHTLDERRVIAYEAGAYGITEPSIYATDYLLAARYRKDVYKNYLFMEIIPQVHYQKTNGFNPEHSVIFRLQLVFNG